MTRNTPVERRQGYSSTPLAKKLGIAEDTRLLLIGAPSGYSKLLGPGLDTLQLETKPGVSVDVAHVFTTERMALEKQLASLRSRLRSNAVVWVSWPKRASEVRTDITEDVVRELALPLGFVDVKVCAVDDVWSGLKLVVRKALR